MRILSVDEFQPLVFKFIKQELVSCAEKYDPSLACKKDNPYLSTRSINADVVLLLPKLVYIMSHELSAASAILSSRSKECVGIYDRFMTYLKSEVAEDQFMIPLWTDEKDYNITNYKLIC